MYILQNVHYVRRSDLETDGLECIWIEVIPEHGKNFLVASGYRHSTYSDFFDRFFSILDKANETNLEIFVLGDLNCDRLKEHSLRDKIDFFYASVWAFTACNWTHKNNWYFKYFDWCDFNDNPISMY